MSEKAEIYYKRAVDHIHRLTGSMPENEEEFKVLLAHYFFGGNLGKANLFLEMMEALVGMGLVKIHGGKMEPAE